MVFSSWLGRTCDGDPDSYTPQLINSCHFDPAFVFATALNPTPWSMLVTCTAANSTDAANTTTAHMPAARAAALAALASADLLATAPSLRGRHAPP